MTRRVHRYEVPVDDRPHAVATTASPIHCAARQPGTVEFWAEHDDQAEPSTTNYIVVGTGHPIPAGARYAGTALALFGLVWHLYELPKAPATAVTP